MSQKDIEVILTRQWASCLGMPAFIVDPQGSLLFYNEPAEQILAQRFEETGEMPFEEWAIGFVPTDKKGAPIPPEDLPLTIALRKRRPAHGSLWIRGRDNSRRHISATAFPLIGHGGRNLGAVAIFWESEHT
jgi:PAS domain-containing protein